MKKKSAIIVLIVILLFCMIGGAIWFISSNNKTGDVANTNVVPTDVPTGALTPEPTEELTGAPTPGPTEELTAAPTQEPTPESEDINDNSREMTLKLELKETDNSRINEILNVSGTYTDSVDNKSTFSYQIPQFHADSESAKIVNQRIVDDIYPLVESEFDGMAIKSSLLNYWIAYDVMECGNIVSILIKVPYPNDGMGYYTYSYDFMNDKEVTNIELLAMKGMTEESFVETACEMGREYFEEYFEELFEGESDAMLEKHQDCIEAAKAATTVELPMYLDSDGTLKVYIPFPSVVDYWDHHLCEF